MSQSSEPEFLVESGQLRIYRIPIENQFPSLSSRALVLKLEGEINLYSSQHIKEIIESEISREVIHIFLDLKDIDYIDSSGLGVFLGMHSKVHRSGGGVHICSPSQKVTHVLALTKLIGLMKTFSSWEDGCKSIE